MRPCLWVILAAVAAVSYISVSSSHASGIDCYTGDAIDEQMPAPSNLWPAVIGAYAGTGWFNVSLTWEGGGTATCWVVERFVGLHLPDDDEFEVRAILAAGGDKAYRDHGPFYSGGPRADYRLYAATASARSPYSDVAHASFPFVTTPPPTPMPPQRGDIDCDGHITAADALVLLRHIARLDVDLPPGCPAISAAGLTNARLLAVPLLLFGGALLYVRRRSADPLKPES
jgi:hypothetical protein